MIAVIVSDNDVGRQFAKFTQTRSSNAEANINQTDRFAVQGDDGS